MKYIITVITVSAIGAIIYGFNLEDVPLSQKFIGGGTATLFLVSMPLFLLKESKGKKLNDYMITDENLKKMREKKSKNTENQ